MIEKCQNCTNNKSCPLAVDRAELDDYELQYIDTCENYRK